jgi:hypothetical protein
MQSRLQNQPNAHAAAGLWPLADRDRQGAYPGALPALKFERLSFLEGLDVIEDNSEEVWEMWDAAVRAGVFHGVNK